MSEKTTLTEDFLTFTAANPHVWFALRDLALEWRRMGKTKCGISLLFGRARWELSMRTDTADAFELNDHFQAFYARALMRFEPELAGMFNLRSAPEADAWIATFDQEAAA